MVGLVESAQAAIFVDNGATRSKDRFKSEHLSRGNLKALKAVRMSLEAYC
jgi:hypothetical protein